MKVNDTQKLVAMAAQYNGAASNLSPAQNNARAEALDRLQSQALKRQAWLKRTGRQESSKGLRRWVRKNQSAFTQLAMINSSVAAEAAA